MSNTESQTPAGNSPTHVAYQVRDGKDKGFWTRIGAAWPHEDGEGFSVQMDVMPIDGKIVLRTPKAEEGQSE